MKVSPLFLQNLHQEGSLFLFSIHNFGHVIWLEAVVAWIGLPFLCIHFCLACGFTALGAKSFLIDIVDSFGLELLFVISHQESKVKPPFHRVLEAPNWSKVSLNVTWWQDL